MDPQGEPLNETLLSPCTPEQHCVRSQASQMFGVSLNDTFSLQGLLMRRRASFNSFASIIQEGSCLAIEGGCAFVDRDEGGALTRLAGVRQSV